MIKDLAKKAWSHKGSILKGAAHLHPGVALVLQMKDLKDTDLAKISSELIAADVERLLGKVDGTEAIVAALRPAIRQIQDRTDAEDADVAVALAILIDEMKPCS